MRQNTVRIILALGLCLPPCIGGVEASAAPLCDLEGRPAATTRPAHQRLAFSDQPASMESDNPGDEDAAATDQAAPANEEDSEPGDGMATPEDQALIDQWYKENDICRGHSGDDEETFKHCDARDALTEQLRAKAWCYGHDGQAEYQREWEGCE